jgi:hypothetical protein
MDGEDVYKEIVIDFESPFCKEGSLTFKNMTKKEALEEFFKWWAGYGKDKSHAMDSIITIPAEGVGSKQLTKYLNLTTFKDEEIVKTYTYSLRFNSGGLNGVLELRTNEVLEGDVLIDKILDTVEEVRDLGSTLEVYVKTPESSHVKPTLTIDPFITNKPLEDGKDIRGCEAREWFKDLMKNI